MSLCLLLVAAAAAGPADPPATTSNRTNAEENISYTRGKDLHQWGGRSGWLIGQAFRAMDAGAHSNALPFLSEVVTLNAADPEVYILRASAYELNGQPDKALADLSAAIRCNPQYRDAWQRRGDLQFRNKRFDKAIADYEQVIRLQPKDAAGYDQLAWLLATSSQPAVRNGKRAVELATRACQLSDWKNASCIDTLAAAHAAAGNFPRAIQLVTRALAFEDLRPADRVATQQRLESYQRKQAWTNQPSQ